MKTSNAEPEEKKTTLYDMILLAESIKTPWKDLTEEQQKMWNPFMVNRFISSRPEYTQIISMLSKYNLSNEDHYNFICGLIDPSRKHYFDYKAYKKKDQKKEDEIDEKLLIYACCQEYEIGAREAKMYLEQMPLSVKTALKEKWEEKFKFEKNL